MADDNTFLKTKAKGMALSTALSKRTGPTSPSLASSTPSPLVLSECSSPSMHSPPPSLALGAMSPLDQGQLFYSTSHQSQPAATQFYSTTSQEGFNSVLTHENNDPMLSATAGPGSNHQQQPFSPNVNNRLSVASSGGGMGEYSPLPYPVQTDFPQQGTSSSSAPSNYNQVTQPINSINTGSAQPDAAPQQTTNDLLNLLQRSQSSNEAPRKGTLNLLGCLATNINIPGSGAKPYVIHIFDRGCYYAHGSESNQDLLAHLRTPKGVQCDVVYTKLDPNRSSFDQVSIQFCDQWAVLPKPGTAIMTIQSIGDELSFYLPTSATQKVDQYFRTLHGQAWIHESGAVLITNTNSPIAGSNDDFKYLQPKTKSVVWQQQQQSAPPPQQQPPQLPTQPLPPNSDELIQHHQVPREEVLHLNNGTITLHAAETSVVAATAAAEPIKEQAIAARVPEPSAQIGGGANPSNLASFQIFSSQYDSLNEDQVGHCTFCMVCKRRFKYVMEHLFHFTISPRCRNYICSYSNAKTPAKPGTNKSFYSGLVQFIAEKCCLELDSRISCNVCLTVLAGPMQYAMHRDQHRPSQGDLMLCQFCAVLFRTPHGFIRHPCIKHWNVSQTLQQIQKQLQSLEKENASDTFKIYGQLSEEERTLLLQCPICRKQNAYMSGLMAHLRFSQPCFKAILENFAGEKNVHDAIDLQTIVFNSKATTLKPRALQCEICGVHSRNQIGYAVHRDHHSLVKQGMFICKGCNKEYRAPCEFYRHNCSATSDDMRLFWCPFCEVSRAFDKARDEANAASNSAQGAEGPSSLQIVSVRSLSSSEEQQQQRSAPNNSVLPSPSITVVSPGGNVKTNNGSSAARSLDDSGGGSSSIHEGTTHKKGSDSGGYVARKTNPSDATSKKRLDGRYAAEATIITNSFPKFEQERSTTSSANGQEAPGAKSTISERSFVASRAVDTAAATTVGEKAPLVFATKSFPKAATQSPSNGNNVKKRPQQENGIVRRKRKGYFMGPKSKNPLFVRREDTYVCTSCSPFKLLFGEKETKAHRVETMGHQQHCISHLRAYNRMKIRVLDLATFAGERGVYANRVKEELKRLEA